MNIKVIQIKYLYKLLVMSHEGKRINLPKDWYNMNNSDIKQYI